MMNTALRTGFFALFLGFIGCTPFSEGVVKKVLPEESAEKVNNGASTGVGRTGFEVVDLDSETRAILRSYGATIRKYSEKYDLDWRLILAVMKAESRFVVEAESHKGASGLMQIMPVTGEEVARVLAIEDMAHPKNNIHAGVFYLRRLYNLFDGVEQSDRIKLTLAAYNAGIGRVYDAQEVAAYFHDDPTRWKAVKDALPLLSKRYYTLHKSVWSSEKPRNGWFGSSRQTLVYVERIMGYYDEYRTVLN
jgi:membrane-bound lytic murein transglycosylase F